MWWNSKPRSPPPHGSEPAGKADDGSLEAMKQLSPLALIRLAARLWQDVCPNGRFPKTEEEVLAVTGADREEVHKLVEQLRGLFPVVGEEPPQSLAPPTPRQQVFEAVIRYEAVHPGSARRSDGPFKATGMFRRFVLGLTASGQPGHGMAIADLAWATGVPEDMLENWLRKATRAEQRHSR